MKQLISCLLLVIASINLNAADIPDLDGSNQQASQAACVDRLTNDCINNDCLNSPELNCQDNCSTQAQNKCQAEQAE